MSKLYYHDPITSELQEVGPDGPLPVRLEETAELPPIAGRTVQRIVQVPGIGTGSAYADKDAFGTLITFRDVFRAEKRSGTITGVFLIDKDDEGIQVDVPLYVRAITATADNSALALSDDDLMACRAKLSITDYFDGANGQFGQSVDAAKWVEGEDTNLYTQLQIRGSANISAGAIPWVGITVIPD